MLLFPTLALLVTVARGIWLAILAKDASSPWNNVGLIAIGVVALVLIVWLFFIPLVRWRTTHFIVTTDRLMAREGVINRTGIDIPMSRITSVRFEHGLHRPDLGLRHADHRVGVARAAATSTTSRRWRRSTRCSTARSTTTPTTTPAAVPQQTEPLPPQGAPAPRDDCRCPARWSSACPSGCPHRARRAA